MNGCVENGKSSTQGGANYAVSTIMFLGNVTTIDSLAIIKQFVFDEKILSFAELIQALRSDWKGYEELRRVILSRGNFFGNDDDTSNFVARKFYDDLYEYVRNKKTVFGYPVLLGDHTGYPSHFKWFGEGTAATPDGRYSGEPLTYGISQTNHKARNGLTALMNAIAKFDPHGISGATVTNFHLDASYGESEEKFEKTADLFETYFKNGGMQFQLNYLDHNDLIDAKANPQDHGDLRVRVTGYSDFFCRLKEETQDSIIRRYKSE
jgi:formate C-acetyltransferase